MTDIRKIKFSKDMHWAAALGHKTKTRRPVEGISSEDVLVQVALPYDVPNHLITQAIAVFKIAGTNEVKWIPCPYGHPGTILHVEGARDFRLRVTAVRVERLHDITDEEAIAEGVASAVGGGYHNYHYPNGAHIKSSPVKSFRTLWESLYGLDAWERNPWVWVISFTDKEEAEAVR